MIWSQPIKDRAAPAVLELVESAARALPAERFLLRLAEFVITNTVENRHSLRKLSREELQVQFIREMNDQYDDIAGIATAFGVDPEPFFRTARDNLESKNPKHPTPGTCRVCGCTETNACVSDEDDEPCHWVDLDETKCSHCFPEERRAHG